MLRASISILSLALASALTSLAPTPLSAQPRCDAPQVMVVVDRSSSMSAARSGELPGGGSKWQVARTAIAELTMAFEANIDFGLAVYPAVDRANSCEPGAVALDVGPHPASELLAAIPAEDPPYAGNWTATAQTLDVVRGYGPMLGDGRDDHVILITDGEQCCFAGGSTCLPEQRFWPVDSVMALRGAGMTVHVIGFGAYVDALTLNRAAIAGGAAFPGCDADGTDPTDLNNCYVQANDLAGLRMALEDIARLITDETCDGFDNDCDGLVDEGYDRDVDGYTLCGSDPSVPGTPLDRSLIDCVDSDAAIHPAAAEVCDGLDNDCDGTIDPGCACTIGETRPCGSDVGVCAPGVQQCLMGAWADCDGEVPPDVETCDGFDQDCDGEVDEGSLCGEGFLCVRGACLDPVPPAMPMADGACCSVAVGSGRPDGGAPGAVAAALLVLALWRRRRR